MINNLPIVRLSYAYVGFPFNRWDIAAKECEVVYWLQRLCHLKWRWHLLICIHIKANASCCLLQVMCSKDSVQANVCPVSWGCRIQQLLLCRRVRPPTLISVLDMTLNNLMMRLRGMWSTLSLPLLPGPLWPSVVASDRALSMG